jgi:hypothetical protein
MAITQAMCTSFKQELLEGRHNFKASSNVHKIALYTSSASLAATTTDYDFTGGGEVVGTGYTVGGNTLTNIAPTTSGTTAFIDFSDTNWTTATITARGALIYSGTAGQARAIAVLDFGSDKSSSAGTFTIVFPTADSSNAILRLA